MAKLDGRIGRILSSPLCITPASVFDPLSGRMADELGYPCAMLPGSSAALHHLGVPDIALNTADAVLDLCRRIKRSMALPLIVDGDHGFGNAINVRRFVEDLVLAGGDAVTIEDTWLPRPLSGSFGPGLSVNEACAKISAAVDGAAGSSLHVIARTSVAVCPTTDALIDRLLAFEETGASALFVSGLKDWDTLSAVSHALSLPLVLGARASALAGNERLATMGVRIALSCSSVSLAAYRGAWDRLVEDAPHRTEGPEDFNDLIDRLSGGPDFRRQATLYANREHPRVP